MTRVSADIKEKLVDSVKSTWNTVYQLAMFNRGENLEQEVDKVCIFYDKHCMSFKYCYVRQILTDCQVQHSFKFVFHAFFWFKI